MKRKRGPKLTATPSCNDVHDGAGQIFWSGAMPELLYERRLCVASISGHVSGSLRAWSGMDIVIVIRNQG